MSKQLFTADIERLAHELPESKDLLYHFRTFNHIRLINDLLTPVVQAHSNHWFILILECIRRASGLTRFEIDEMIEEETQFWDFIDHAAPGKYEETCYESPFLSLKYELEVLGIRQPQDLAMEASKQMTAKPIELRRRTEALDACFEMALQQGIFHSIDRTCMIT